MKKIRIGAINWDASLTKDTYFGFYQIRSLSQAKYRTWVPYYATLLDGETVDYPARTVKEYERELLYAIEAGIDYFAYVWYPTEGSLLHTPQSPNDCSHKVYELNYARRLYEQRSLTDRIGMCALIGRHPFTDSDLEELLGAFSKPYYEKIGERPLLYINGGYKEEIIQRIHALCRAHQLPIPYTVPLCEGDRELPQKTDLADALSAYAVRNQKNVREYRELCEIAMQDDRMRLASGKPIIPLFTVGWNPSPRIDRTTPWTTNAQGQTNYALVDYVSPFADEQELVAGAKRFSEHVKEDVGEQFVGHILTFAWNEFEEGGFICPTYTESGSVSTARVQVFAKAVDVLRAALEGSET